MQLAGLRVKLTFVHARACVRTRVYVCIILKLSSCFRVTYNSQTVSSNFRVTTYIYFCLCTLPWVSSINQGGLRPKVLTETHTIWHIRDGSYMNVCMCYMYMCLS